MSFVSLLILENKIFQRNSSYCSLLEGIGRWLLDDENFSCSFDITNDNEASPVASSPVYPQLVVKMIYITQTSINENKKFIEANMIAVSFQLSLYKISCLVSRFSFLQNVHVTCFEQFPHTLKSIKPKPPKTFRGAMN